ncbi:MAG: LysM peptidoglycan-binding domain-containing protein [Phycisphaeraceae bacterium]
MTRETKVGLLVGMGLILLIGVIVSDHWAVVQRQAPAELTGLAEQAQHSIHHVRQDATNRATARAPAVPAGPASPSRRQGPVPTPAELEQLARTRAGDSLHPALVVGQGGRVGSAPDAGDTPREPRKPAWSQPGEQPPAAPPAPEITHRVERGESLYRIAERYYRNGDYWHSIVEANPDLINDDGQVRAGDELVIPNRAGLVELEGFEPAGPAERMIRITDLPRDRQAPAAEIEVGRGDTLSGLAAVHLGSSARWRELLEANRDKLDSAEQLWAGMTLRVPGASPSRSTPPRVYTVRAGDSLTRIAARELGDAARWREIFDANRDQLSSPDAVREGQRLRLP